MDLIQFLNNRIRCSNFRNKSQLTDALSSQTSRINTGNALDYCWKDYLYQLDQGKSLLRRKSQLMTP